MPFDIEIDKLTRSVENAISGDSFKTEIILLSKADSKNIRKADWLFDWKAELKKEESSVYKLVIVNNQPIIQGLISLQDKGDHIFMALIESAKFNRGRHKLYLGVPGNLVAYACKLSFEKGYAGYVSFESKSSLIPHYQNSLGAHVLFRNIMAIDTRAAQKLITRYFNAFS